MKTQVFRLAKLRRLINRYWCGRGVSCIHLLLSNKTINPLPIFSASAANELTASHVSLNSFHSNRGSPYEPDDTKQRTIWNVAFSDSIGSARSILRHQPVIWIRLGTLHFDSVCDGLGTAKELQVVMLCRLSYSVLNFDVPTSEVTHVKPNRKWAQHASPHTSLARFMCPSWEEDEIKHPTRDNVTRSGERLVKGFTCIEQ
jgi:hypothetical protein